MDVALEELTLHVLRRNDLAPGFAQQISPGRDIEQLVVQLGGQAQVAQHQTRLRRQAVQQLLLHRRQPFTLAFLDDEYAQQLAAVPDGADVPARHRASESSESSGGAGGSPSAARVDRGKPNRPPASSHTWTRRAPTPAARTFAIHIGVSCADAPLSGAKWASTSYGSGCGRPDRRFAHVRNLRRTGSNPTATIAVATTDSSVLGASERPMKRPPTTTTTT